MGKGVLIIDDSLTVRMDLCEAFGDMGYRTFHAATLAEARSAVEANPPALILLDRVLPDGDGSDFLASLRKQPAIAATPVILLASEAEIADRSQTLAHRADEYIKKPYEIAHVLQTAAALLEGKQSVMSAKLRILVIDDSLTYREELAESLLKAGYLPTMASSGEEGLQKASVVRPDLIIVDGVMEGMSGTAVVRRIRLDPSLYATPCLLLTASEDADSEVVTLDAGADAYVHKKQGTEVVLARVAAIVRSAQSSRGQAHSSSLSGPKRILAVDDSLTYLEALASELRAEGYEIVKAHSGAEALDVLRTQDVDCILLDLVMPEMTGTDTCMRIKVDQELRRIPLIMLTATIENSAMIDAINAGADDFVSKSAEFDILKARLRAQLRRKQFEDENRRITDELLRKDVEAQTLRTLSNARQELLDELSKKNRDLAFHIDELRRLNQELEVFAYSVSHDLRQPLRGMDGFSKVLLERYSDVLDEQGRHYLGRICAGAHRMSDLIDGLLALSRVSRKPLERRPVALDALAHDIVERLRDAYPELEVDVRVEKDLRVQADPQLIESVLENLIGNAWKFSSKCAAAAIEIGTQQGAEKGVYFVRDNGAGFDMSYADKLFGPFQRLHSQSDFAGTGIGLATVQRILHRHGGRIWAESAPGSGATFFFTLHEGVTT